MISKGDMKMGMYTTGLIKILKVFENYGWNKSLLMLGKQHINIIWDEFIPIIDRLHIKYDKELCETLRLSDDIDSYLFFKMFGFEKVDALDFSEMDDANIIFDLNDDLPKELCGKYDYIIDGGTLEHVFDAPKAMKNMALLCGMNGIIISTPPLAGYVDHGFYSISPSFYLDFYSVNGFEVKDIFMEFMLGEFQYGSKDYAKLSAIYSEDCRLFKKSPEDWANIFLQSYIDKISNIEGVVHSYLWCIAQKKQIKEIRYPIQNMYIQLDKIAKQKKEGEAKERRRICWENVVAFIKENENSKVALFCAGNISRLLIERLYMSDLEETIKVIFDNDISKAGISFEGREGYTIAYPTKRKLALYDKIVICSDIYDGEVYDMLRDMGIEENRLYKITEI